MENELTHDFQQKLEFNNIYNTLPLLPLKGLTVFPHMVLHFDVSRKKSVLALERAISENQKIFLVSQANPDADDPEFDDLCKIGTISTVKQLLKLPDGAGVRVLVEGERRAEIVELTQHEPFIRVAAVPFDDIISNDFLETEALIRAAKEQFETYFYKFNKAPAITIASIMDIDDSGMLADVIASNLFTKRDITQEILEERRGNRRLEKVIELMHHEIEVLELERNISFKVKKQMDKTQRDYFLREQIRVIQSELGEGVAEEIDLYKKRINDAGLPPEVAKKLYREVDRLEKMPQAMGEGMVIRNYIDTVLELPWNVSTKDRFSVKRAEKMINQNHYGLEKVKERILEYICVKHLTRKMKGPILCLVGPPGVGKTSIAKSIADSLGRKYVRISLGGVRDEAEIRGHRRTYIGAMPGRIMSAVGQAKSNNPFILLDEIDKISGDFRGDPAAALLEVLDSEQNFSFADHYVDMSFDLSNVFFMATANSLDTIPRPLLDRMEIISISGYTALEKEQIAVKYILPKLLKNHGLKSANIKVTAEAVRDIINFYTREAGVRALEREIAALCRKTAKLIADDNTKKITITSKNLVEYLGKHKFFHDSSRENDEVGVATGLAWTSVGGDILSIEVNVMNGSGKLELTGKLGDVMQESAKAAISYIRSRTGELPINENFYKDMDIHIHVPEGATPKDGPSAGITIGTALLSALTNVPVKKEVAMTGEITLRGRVLPIGGLKEKVLAAHRAGISTVILPAENERDLDDIPNNVREQMEFVLADSMDVVARNALYN